ncbi:MAG TPA: GNAT family N-acetyltransferase [Aequorivita sp.]|nr:GNAT family N-acetyltransferase [Aequorivita sp.]
MINRLDWDSACFGYEVGEVTVGDFLDWQQFIEESGAYQLVYIFSKKKLDSLPLGINKVDEKMTLVTNLRSFRETIYNKENALAEQVFRFGFFKNGVFDTLGQNLEKEFLELALASGEYSRFRNDDKFIKGEYKKLYRSWAGRSLSGDDDGFVFLHENKISGLITLSSNGSGSFKVGLLSVLKDCREQGVGSLLIDLVCGMAREKAGQEVLVTTQKANKQALKFYLNRGFTILDEQNVYHWWKG